MKTYRQSLDELHFTREEKNAMVDRLTAGEGRGSGKVRSIRRTVTVGVAAALLMTMGVGAAVTLTPAGEGAFPHLPKAPPYEGANDYIWVEDVDDRDTMTALTRLTCLALRAQPKKRRK